MSFGFSPSDIITLITLTKKVYDGWNGAGTEFTDIVQTLGSFKILLEHVNRRFDAPEFVERKEELHNVLQGCEDAVSELDEDTKSPKEKLARHVGLLDVFLMTLKFDSLGKDVRTVRDFVDRMPDIVRNVLPAAFGRIIDARTVDSRSARSSVMTTYGDDDKLAWRELRRSLRKLGVGDAELRRQKHRLVSFVKSVVAEDQAVPRQEEGVDLKGRATPETIDASSHHEVGQEHGVPRVDDIHLDHSTAVARKAVESPEIAISPALEIIDERLSSTDLHMSEQDEMMFGLTTDGYSKTRLDQGRREKIHGSSVDRITISQDKVEISDTVNNAPSIGFAQWDHQKLSISPDRSSVLAQSCELTTSPEPGRQSADLSRQSVDQTDTSAGTVADQTNYVDAGLKSHSTLRRFTGDRSSANDPCSVPDALPGSSSLKPGTVEESTTGRKVLKENTTERRNITLSYHAYVESETDDELVAPADLRGGIDGPLLEAINEETSTRLGNDEISSKTAPYELPKNETYHHETRANVSIYRDEPHVVENLEPSDFIPWPRCPEVDSISNRGPEYTSGYEARAAAASHKVVNSQQLWSRITADIRERRHIADTDVRSLPGTNATCGCSDCSSYDFSFEQDWSPIMAELDARQGSSGTSSELPLDQVAVCGCSECGVSESDTNSDASHYYHTVGTKPVAESPRLPGTLLLEYQPLNASIEGRLTVQLYMLSDVTLCYSERGAPYLSTRGKSANSVLGPGEKKPLHIPIAADRVHEDRSCHGSVGSRNCNCAILSWSSSMEEQHPSSMDYLRRWVINSQFLIYRPVD